MTNVRRTLAVKIQTPGGDNPLRMQLVGRGPFFRGIPVTGLALVAKGGTAPYAFSIIAGGDSNGDVDGLTLNADGTFSGSPDEAGRFIFVAQVQDAASDVFSHSFSLTVLPQLIVVAGTPTPGENLLAYTYQFIVRDLTGTTITSGYTISGGTITPGLSLSGAGILSGNPSFAAIGFNYFTVTVTNGSDSIDIPVVQRIYEPFLAIGIEQKVYFYAGIAQVADGQSTFSPTGGLEPYSFRWDNLTDYPWLSYDYNTGLFSGTPPIENIGIEQTITGQVSDALGAVITPFTFKFTPVFAQAGINVGGDLIHAPPETGYTVFGSSDGSVQITPDTSGGLDFTATGGGGGSQAAIQFKDEGSNLGTSGTATSFNVVGAGAALARVGNALTLTVPGSTDGIQTIEGVHPDSAGNINVDGIHQDSNGHLVVDFPSAARKGPGCVFTNGGLLLSGTLTSEVEIPYAFSGTGWTIVGDVAGSASIVVSHATYANYDTMTTSLTATVTTAKKNRATGLTYSFAAGDVVRFVASGFSLFTRCSIQLDGTPS